MIQVILLDVEGTTSTIDFVHQTLFPYAASHLPAFVREHEHNPEVQACLKSVQDTVMEEDNRNLEGIDCAIAVLLGWIQSDRKHTALKTLQGLIWKSGYEQGAFAGHVYEDVPQAFKAWTEQGLRMGIYSSGSVEAQKLLFRHSTAGDLTPYLSFHFDTHIGHKRESESYTRITEFLAVSPDTILFLSDIEEELDAAHTAGFQVLRVNRTPDDWNSKYPVIHTFDEITSQPIEQSAISTTR